MMIFFQIPADCSCLSTIIFSYLSSEKLRPRLKQFDIVCGPFIPIVLRSFLYHWVLMSSYHTGPHCQALSKASIHLLVWAFCFYVLFISKRVLSRGKRIAIIRIRLFFLPKQACVYSSISLLWCVEPPGPSLVAVSMAHGSTQVTSLFHLGPSAGPICPLLLCRAKFLLLPGRIHVFLSVCLLNLVLRIVCFVSLLTILRNVYIFI